MKKYKGLRYLVNLVIILALLLVCAVPVFAQTSADVTVTATGAFVGYTASQTTYAFGIIAASSTTNTTANWILFTNTSSISTNISVKMLATTWTAAADGWTHSDTAAGVNTAAMKAGSGNTSTWQTSVFIKFAAPFNEIAQGVAANSNYVSGLSLLAPTSFTNGNSNNNTIRFSFYQS
jgi:hypothetical protein